MRELDSIPLQDLTAQYLYKTHANNSSIKSGILGYTTDDPSDEYLKCNVLGIKELPKENISTAYTIRMSRAVSFFKEKLAGLENNDEVLNLYNLITTKLVFNEYFVEGEKDVSMIFESMNNRGKQLSTLELLKNRLMYISEKLALKDDERIELRKKIRKSWKIVYEWLGKDKLLEDDEFLKAHWIMYYKYDRQKREAFREDLLNETFSLKNIYSKTNVMNYKKISEYVVSLSDAVQHWYYINFPDRALGRYDQKVVEELARINRTEYTTFRPLILALLVEIDGVRDLDDCVRMLKKCEEYIFKVYGLTMSSSNKGDSHFYKLAKDFHDKKYTISGVVKDIGEEIKSTFRLQNFLQKIEEYFEHYEDGGFYKWNFIDYFLFEYDLYLREKNKGAEGKSINWSEYTTYKKDFVSIEHIYPQKDYKKCWVEKFGNLTQSERNALKHSLGNLLPLSTKRNSSFQNNCFKDKKDDGKGGGYYVGSYSEAEVNRLEEWGPADIRERGIRLLEFLEERWDVKFEDKIDLLHLKEEY